MIKQKNKTNPIKGITFRGGINLTEILFQKRYEWLRTNLGEICLSELELRVDNCEIVLKNIQNSKENSGVEELHGDRSKATEKLYLDNKRLFEEKITNDFDNPKKESILKIKAYTIHSIKERF